MSTEEKWELYMWEHSDGNSRAAKEWERIPSEISRIAEKKIFTFQRKTFSELKATNDLVKVKGMKGVSRIKIKSLRNQIRVWGVEHKVLKRFDALHVVQKKTQKIKKSDFDLTLERLQEYKIIEKLL